MSVPNPLPPGVIPTPTTPAGEVQADLAAALLQRRAQLKGQITEWQAAATLITDAQARIAAIDAQLTAWGVTPPP